MNYGFSDLLPLLLRVHLLRYQCIHHRLLLREHIFLLNQLLETFLFNVIQLVDDLVVLFGENVPLTCRPAILWSDLKQEGSLSEVHNWPDQEEVQENEDCGATCTDRA